MYSILEEMYRGNIYPDEAIVPRSVDYKGLNERISELVMQWREKLSEADFQELEKLLDLKNDVNALQSQESFIHGFKLGSLMMIEIYTNTDKLLRK